MQQNRETEHVRGFNLDSLALNAAVLLPLRAERHLTERLREKTEKFLLSPFVKKLSGKQARRNRI